MRIFNLLLVILSLLASSTNAATYKVSLGANREIWIGPGSEVRGNGSYNEPFLTRNASDFDSLMAAVIDAGAKVIHLTPGEFQTDGQSPGNGSGWILGTGMKLLGASPELTTLRRAKGNEGKDAVVIQGSGNRIEVSELTVDCAAKETDPGKSEAVRLIGNFNVIRNVVAERATGRGTQEASVFETGGSGKFGNVVDSCIVTNVVKPASKGVLSLNGFKGKGNCTFKDCRVYLPVAADSAGRCFAIEGDGLSITRCYAAGGTESVYSSSEAENITIQDCFFTGVRNGVAFDLKRPGVSISNIKIADNVFEFALNTRAASVGVGVFTYKGIPVSAKNIRITENTFRNMEDTPSKVGDPRFAVKMEDKGKYINNVTVFNNSLDQSLLMFQGDSAQTPGNNTLYVLNRTLDGALPSEINQPVFSHDKHRVITSASETISADDGFVTIKMDQDSTFILPAVSSLDRDTITVFNAQKRGRKATVIIKPPPGRVIQPGNLKFVTIEPNGFARFRFDGTAWYRN